MGPGGGAPRASADTVRADGHVEGDVGVAVHVLASEADGRRPVARPERVVVEGVADLVEVEVGHHDGLAEAVAHVDVAPVADGPLVERAAAGRRAPGRRSGAGRGARRGYHRVLPGSMRSHTCSAARVPSSWKP